MGNSYSCYQCFSKETQGSICDSLSQSKDVETLSSTPFLSTSDQDQSMNSETEAVEAESLSKTDLIDQISKVFTRFSSELESSPESLGYKKAQTSGSVEVWLKDIPSSYSLLSIWKCDVEAFKVANFLKLVEKRKDWDTNVAECKKICDITEEIAVYYTLYKRFLMTAPRDTLIVGQHKRTENGFLDVSTSINSQLVPESPSIVRAQVGIAGYFIRSIEKDEAGNVTEVRSISEANFGQSVAVSFVKTTSVNLTPKFVKSMVEGMKKFDSLLS
jgi:hypothetical protein